MNETGLFGVFQEINSFEPDKRETTHDNCSKLICHVLATEGMLRNVKGIEIIECSKIIESDHRGYLTDVDFSDYFAEEFVERTYGAIEV